MLVTHSTSTPSVQDINSTTSHSLVTIPIALVITWSYSISKLQLAIHSRPEGISVLFTSSRQVTWTNEDWLLVLVNNTSPMALEGIITLRSEVLNYWSILRNLIVVDQVTLLREMLRRNVFEHIFSKKLRK